MYGVPNWLCRLLHSADDIVGDSRHGWWKTGRGALSSIDAGQPLPDLRAV